MSAFHKLATWHQTKTGFLVFGLIELGLAYAFASWAIDSGSLIDYFLAIVLLAGFAQNFVKLIVKVVHHG
jgi:hypothetical protein